MKGDRCESTADRGVLLREHPGTRRGDCNRLAGGRRPGRHRPGIPGITGSPDDVSLLILAAPTHNRGLPTPSSRRSAQAKGGSPEEPGIREWLEAATIPEGARVLAIDTVTQRSWISGSAAKRIAKMLGRRNVDTRSFVVASGQGPLAEEEARAARAWAAGLV